MSNWLKKSRLLYEHFIGVEVYGSNNNQKLIDSAFLEICQKAQVIKNNRRCIYFIGNGASASMASHFSADIGKNYHVNTQVLTDMSLLTAYANDVDYESVYSAPLADRITRNDMLIAVSSSGSSKNIINAVEVANEKGAFVASFSGMSPDNLLRKMGDLNFYIPAKTYSHVETCHAAVLHHWVDLLLDEVKHQNKVNEAIGHI